MKTCRNTLTRQLSPLLSVTLWVSALQLETVQATIKNAVDAAVQSAVAHFSERVDALESMAEKKRIGYLEAELNSTQSQVKLAIAEANDNEQYSRKYILRIFGLEEKADKNCTELLKEFCATKLNFQLSVAEVDRVHRVAKKQLGKCRPILVKFISYRTKMELMKRKSKLKGSRLFINEDLTRFNMRLYRFGRVEASSVQSVWISDGKIFVRNQEDQIFIIKHMDDFEKYDLE